MTNSIWIAGNRINVDKLTSSFGEHGDEQVTFELPYNRLKGLKWRQRVTLWHPTYHYYWNGYLAVVAPSLESGSCVKITCRGMYKTAGDIKYYEDKIFRAGTPCETMLRDALSKCANIQDSGHLNDVGFQLVEDTPSFGTQSPNEVFTYIQQLTAYLATPLIWDVHSLPDQPESVLRTYAADFAPRYRVRLGSNDSFTPTYDCDIVYNVGLVQWGNQQYQMGTESGYSAPQLPQNPFIAPAIPLVNYATIPDIRMKSMNVSGTINNIQEIQQLSRFLVTRNNNVRPSAATLVLDNATRVSSVYPEPIDGNLPHELIHSNVSIEILNDLTTWGMFGITTFYIISAKTDYDTCKTTLELGFDNILQDAFRILGSYDVSREYISVRSSLINLVHRDADVLIQYGTEFPGSVVTNPDDATMLNNFSAGVVTGIGTTDSTTGAPKKDDKDKQFYAPTGVSIDPNIIADYGVFANFGREADSVGAKGFIKVIPCRMVNWSIDFTAPPGSTTIPTDSITIKFYQIYPFISGSATPFATKSVASAQENHNVFSGTELVNFPLGGKIGIEVSVAAATPGCGFQVGIGGRKLYPDLALNS